MKARAVVGLWLGLVLGAGAVKAAPPMPTELAALALDYTTPTDPALQPRLAAIDAELRAKFGLGAEATAVGLLDLRTGRWAAVRPDRIDYAASVPKIGILLAWFAKQPRALAEAPPPEVRRDLGLMIKRSDNATAAAFSRQLGLAAIQEVLDAHGFYDAARGGGIWIGKHYGQGGERRLDPVGGHSHAATVRQLVRFYLLLEQGKLVSPAASAVMREIFASPEIAPIDDKFVRGLAGRPREIRRKAGWWEAWVHDTAVITGPDRHYVLAAMTQGARGEEYLVALAPAVDALLGPEPAGK